MRSWLRRRRERLERVEAEADALILDLGETAFPQARRREHEASSDAMAREWNRVALAVARKTGQTVGLNASTRIATTPSRWRNSGFNSLAFRPIARQSSWGK
jgi:hypothetical protein